jgi:predicted TIM-barrel fold metal-dependent hydrolase
MKSEKAAWLARRTEPAIDPEVPVVDPHHHLWDRNRSTYLVPQLHEDTGGGHNVVKTVFVECMSEYRTDGPEALRPVGETAFVAEQARLSRADGGAPIAGIVSYADLTLGDAVEEVLAAHEAAGDGLFRGIRHATGWDADDRVPNSHTNPPEGVMRDERFRTGLRKLGELGYRFDSWCYHPQQADVADLARSAPGTPIVADHLGAPMGIGPYAGRRAEVLEQWRPMMKDLASCENVVLKVGGIGMERYYGGPWTSRDAPPSSEELAEYWADVVHFCIDTFGPSRCMLESNFPVDRETCSYVVLWNALKRLAAPYADTERADLLGGTAERFYDV